MTIQDKPILHGRDHMADGPDPIPGAGGGAAHIIEDEGTPLTARANLNFVGAGVTATDDAANDQSDITIPGISAVFGIGQPGQRIGTTEDRWYLPGHQTFAAATTTSPTANDRALWPFIPGRNMTLDRIAIRVTAAVAASNVKLGIYTDNGNLYPNALLFDTGNVATATTGAKITTISQAVTAGTLYWVCCHHSAAIQASGIQYADSMPILGWAVPGAGSPACALGWFQNVAYAALPNPYPAGAGFITTAVALNSCCFLRGT